MWVFPVPSLPEPGTGLQVSCAGAIEWQAPSSKKYTIGQIKGINTGEAGSLYIWIDIRYAIFGEDGLFWVWTDMRQWYWEIIVEYNMYSPG